jgi:CRP/FNR family transcriptional regulator
MGSRADIRQAACAERTVNGLGTASLGRALRQATSRRGGQCQHAWGWNMGVGRVEHVTLAAQPMGASRRLRRGETLFRRGEPRAHLYLVEAGTIAVYRQRPHRPRQVLEFAFAGDIVGFGLLPQHAFSAMALAPARVRALPLAARAELLDHSPRAARRYAEAIAREYLASREELVAAFCGQPVRQLAALLLAISRLNRHEGRDPTLIVDALTCKTVACSLGLDVDTLARALVALADLGLVAHAPPSELRILDVAGLAMLCGEERPLKGHGD